MINLIQKDINMKNFRMTNINQRLIFLIAFFACIAISVPALAAPKAGSGTTTPPPSTSTSAPGPATSACEGIEAAGGNCDATTANVGFKNIITAVVNVLSVVVGAVSVVMIIIGGFRYVISGGDSNGISGAKNTILYAIVGLVVVLFAQVIVAFVYKSATTAPATPGNPSSPATPVNPNAPATPQNPPASTTPANPTAPANPKTNSGGN